MARRDKKPRRIVARGEVFLWSLSHTHRVLGNGKYENCCETLVIRPYKTPGCLRIIFEEGIGRLVPDGHLMPSGAVGKAADRTLNLHEPGTVGALLDAAVSRGRDAHGSVTEEIDGWSIFDEVAAHRGTAPPD